jgi:hypothetical protein
MWLLDMMTLICFGALPLWMGLVPPRVRAFIGIIPELSTIVANAGRKLFRLGKLLMGLLAAVVTLFALARTKFLVGKSPLTQFHFGECSLTASAIPFFLGKFHW